VSESPKPNSWSRAAAPHAGLGSGTEEERSQQVEWQLVLLSAGDEGVLFERVFANPFLRVLTGFAKRKMFALASGLVLIAASAYCLAAPAGSTLAGLPVEFCSIALAAAAMLLALLVTLGAWMRPLESVEDAVEVLSVPLIAFEKGGTADVR
jgi:hypothetical protein